MNPLLILLVIACYFSLLFVVALISRKDSPRALKLSQSPLVYSLSLAVYCTSWTYYGSVGLAANSGLSFLAIYLGPTLMVCLWCLVLRRMVSIKDSYRITSIADFISARYNKSQLLAALITVMALIGNMPYIALQLEAVRSTFSLLAAHEMSGSSWIIKHFSTLLVLLLSFFTIVFGARKLDPTERHRGIMTAIAFESVVKLVAFSACGIYVCLLITSPAGGGFSSLLAHPAAARVFSIASEGSSYASWTTMMLLSMSAILFLPRQFHVAVVENSSPRHIFSAIWQFPLYMLLINIFVIPIALYGITSGLPLTSADTYVLQIPVAHGNHLLALVVFLGGFSAAMSMIIVSAMTMSTMMVNHLLLPLFNLLPLLAPMRRLLLGWRWISILVILSVGSWFRAELGDSFDLVNMGLISFAAVLQFAPAGLGAVLWAGGSREGAFAGLTAGFGVWFYTLMLPAFIKSGLLSGALLDNGPWGIGFLRPEHLFGLELLPPLSHTVFWSLVFNIGAFVLVSLWRGQSEEERSIARDFIACGSNRPIVMIGQARDDSVDFLQKQQGIREVLCDYFPAEKSLAITNASMNALSLSGRTRISIIEYADFHRSIEIILAGSIGAPMAHRALGRDDIFSRLERARLSEALGEILIRLKVSPLELAQKLDFYQQREQQLTSRSEQLEQKIREKEEEIEIRRAAEQELSRNHEKLEQTVRLRTAEIVENQAFLQEVLENIQAAVVVIDRETHELLDCNSNAEKLLGYEKQELVAESRLLAATRILEQESEGQLQNRELLAEDRNGREVPVLRNVLQVFYHGMPAEAILLFDLSEHKALEQRVSMAHRLQSIGQLAAGIAHEINTPIQYIGSNIGFLAESFQQLLETNNLYKTLMDRARAGEDISREIAEVAHHIETLDLHYLLEEIPHAVNESLSGINQVSAIIKAMKQFSQPEQDSEAAVNINRALEQTAIITRSAWKHAGDLELDLDRNNPTLTGSPSLVNQVFLNLMINCAQAVSSNKEQSGEKGKILIQSKGKGTEILVSFTHTGEPGPDSQQLNIASLLIEEKLGGTLHVDHPAGQGCRFILHLPSR